MIERTRAWRRKTTRKVIARVKATKQWFVHQFQDENPKKVKQLKKHRPGALTGKQQLRLEMGLNIEERDNRFEDAA